ncbi:helix-turn-helix domain-containing protein [uncultured Microbacterium sp.]|uniref:helix-turn-helix domain-containing protein n=1 Tax=uncultured Microbacterium sp. TaxID=191216 RepID=UPI00261B9516|nr:helix-turn-helix domain-containing protein [uncultured Microbacterium sp.]
MTTRKPATVERRALTIAEASLSVGVSVDKIRQHIERGELVATYVDFKPVIAVKELDRWLESLPNERPAAR